MYGIRLFGADSEVGEGAAGGMWLHALKCPVCCPLSLSALNPCCAASGAPACMRGKGGVVCDFAQPL